MWLNDLVADIRVATRSLLRSPGFSIAAVCSLGFGIALMTATLILVNVYLLRTFPYPHGDRLYHVVYAPPGQREPVGLAAMDWQALSDVIEVADSSTGTRFYLRDAGAAEEVTGLFVARGSLEALDVRAVHGRSLETTDFSSNGEPVVLLGEGFWRSRFGGDAAVIGRVLRLSIGETPVAQGFRVVGILPPGFRWAREYARDPVQIVAPLRGRPRVYMVRLRAGVGAAAAAERITTAARALAGTSAAPEWRVQLQSVHERYVETLRPVLVAITGATALVMVIVVANVSILTLLRTMRRRGEIMLRFAMGADHRRIVRLLLTEGGLICGAAVTLGIIGTSFALQSLAPVIERQLERPVPGGTSALIIDSKVLLIIGGVALLTVLSVAFVPLLARWQTRLGDALHAVGRTTTDGRSVRWLRSTLIAMEIAGSLALLVGCGLLVRSALNLTSTELGIRTEGVVRTRLALPVQAYATPPSFVTFDRQLREQVESEHARVALTNYPPLVEGIGRPIQRRGDDSASVTAQVVRVSPSYFDVLGLALMRGRLIGDDNQFGAESVAVVSESLARGLWPGQDPVGHEIQVVEQSSAGRHPGAPQRVIGVVRDARQTFSDTALADVYLALYQHPGPFGFVSALIRTDRPAGYWSEAMPRLVRDINSNVLVAPVTTLRETADRLLEGPQFFASILTGFALFALLLAVLGIYCVTAYVTEQRESEIAIRMALGATRREIVGLLVRTGALMIAAGVTGGVVGAAMLAGMLRRQLFGVPAFDLVTVAGASVLIILSGLLATWWPAHRAAGKNPAAILQKL